MRVAQAFKSFGITLAAVTFASGANAQDNLGPLESIGKPIDKLMGFQEPVTEVARDIQALDNMLLWIIGVITAFVTVLLLICIVRYNSRSNPTPARFTHNTPLELAWTFIPVIILLAMIPPSLKLLNKQLITPEADITIKATGNQWYWTHEYVDNGFEFDSVMLEKSELAEYGFAEDEYLLATDTSVVVPINKTVVVQITGSDVIHAWTIPAFGVKQDAVPGRLAEVWFKAEKEGIYFGQCSELCGKDHSYMPITVKVVSQAKYDAWLDGAIKEYAGTPRKVVVADAGMKMVKEAEASSK